MVLVIRFQRIRSLKLVQFEPGETQEFAKCVNIVIYFKSYVRENETIRRSFLSCNNLL